jgi:hypothetical protein
MAPRGGPGADAGGIHSLHFLDDAEKSVQLREHALTFGRKLEPRQIGDAVDVVRVSAIEKMPIRNPM